MDRRLALAALQSTGALSPVDIHLSKLVARLTGETRPEVHLAMALASQWPQRGHVCVDLASLQARELWESEDMAPLDEPLELPSKEDWITSLRDSAGIGAPEEATPFVLWQDRWLYLRRHWTYEQTVVHFLSRWLNHDPPPAEAAETEDLQERAVQLAAHHPFFILTGGPGTGKTTTVVRILCHLLSLQPSLTIALAAPTGKAALRLQESIADGLGRLEIEDAIRQAIPDSAHTLHRLLGYQRHKTTFRHHPENPLPFDLVIVDEASMMDLGLFAKLLQALPPSARLLLVGDREQLPSVDAGAVFSALCTPASPMPRVELTRNYRFSQNTGIGALALAIRDGDADMTELLLTDKEDTSCQLEALPGPNQLREALWQSLEPYLRSLASADEPVSAFQQFDQLRILCAHRSGPHGSEAINDCIHDLLVSRLRQSRAPRWFPGRPILITENDYAAELYNGDTGIVLPWNGKLHVFFRNGEGGFRHLPPARLPAHESAYAMTVHKSQGSEFDDVLLVLTDQPSRLLTRELLYTGITRARSSVRVWGPVSAVRNSVDRPLERTSGLGAWFETQTLPSE